MRVLDLRPSCDIAKADVVKIAQVYKAYAFDNVYYEFLLCQYDRAGML